MPGTWPGIRHHPKFSKIVESTSDGIDGPWIVTHIGQGGMVDELGI